MLFSVRPSRQTGAKPIIPGSCIMLLAVYGQVSVGATNTPGAQLRAGKPAECLSGINQDMKVRAKVKSTATCYLMDTAHHPRGDEVVVMEQQDSSKSDLWFPSYCVT